MNLNRALCELNLKVEEIKLKLQPEGTDAELLDRIDKAVKLMLTIESKIIEPFISICDYSTRPPTFNRLEVYDTTYEKPWFSGGRLYYDINGNIITSPKYADYDKFGDVIQGSLNSPAINMIIHGNTIGGYNEVTGESEPFSSSCESEGNILKVKSLGNNVANCANVVYGHYWLNEEQTLANAFYVKTKVPKEGMIFTMECKSKEPFRCVVQCYNAENEVEFLEYSGISQDSFTIKIPPEKCSYVIFSQLDLPNKVDDFLIQLEEGNEPTLYQPYIERESSLQLDNPLRKFDYFNAENGVFTKGTKSFIINGETELQPHKENGTWISVVFTGVTLVEAMSNIPVRKWENNYHVYGLWWFGESSAGLSIEKSKLITPNFDGVKDWISKNLIYGYAKSSQPESFFVGELIHKTIRSSKGYIVSGNEVAPSLSSCKVLKEQ